MICDIIKYPNPLLTSTSIEVDDYDDIKDIVNKLLCTITHNKNCAGLSAPQIGILKRIILVDSLIDTETRLLLGIPKHYVMINPKILSHDSKIIKDQEGCMSFPGISEKVCRYNSITVEYKDINLITHIIKADGLFSKCIQHEIDHLDGILIKDRMSSIRKNRFLKKYKLRG